jgi:hypothetical protein
MHWLPFTLRKVRSIEKSSDFIRNWTLNLPACSIVPQPTVPPLYAISCSSLILFFIWNWNVTELDAYKKLVAEFSLISFHGHEAWML